MNKNDPSRLLPASAVAMLQRATKTPITARDPLARVKAIEQAHRRIKLQFPQYFKESNHES
jgi:hypothetical protein